jgi:putative ABC transport system substrate-binding protein
VSSRFMNSSRPRVVEFANKQRIPLVTGWGPWARAGSFMSYGPDFDILVRRAATHVDKILKGTKPADLPVEQPTKFELVINLKTAKALGLTIPPALLLRADQVIE